MTARAEHAETLHAAAKDFMERCASEAGAVALHGLSLASGLMLSQHLYTGIDPRPLKHPPRLVVVRGEEHPSGDYILGSYSQDMPEESLLNMIWTSRTEAYAIPPHGAEQIRLTGWDIVALRYDVNSVRPEHLLGEDAQFLLDKMIEYVRE